MQLKHEILSALMIGTSEQILPPHVLCQHPLSKGSLQIDSLMSLIVIFHTVNLRFYFVAIRTQSTFSGVLAEDLTECVWFLTNSQLILRASPLHSLIESYSKAFVIRPHRIAFSFWRAFNKQPSKFDANSDNKAFYNNNTTSQTIPT